MRRYPSPNILYADGEYWGYCQACGVKRLFSELTKIGDQHHDYYGLRVCEEDALPQSPQVWKSVNIEEKAPAETSPDDRRVYQTASTYDHIINGGITTTEVTEVASAPRHPFIIETTTTTIELEWTPPWDNGRTTILGYKIERESPEGGGFSTLTSNTGTDACYYLDTGLTAGTEYNYRISAVSRAGTSTETVTKVITTMSS